MKTFVLVLVYWMTGNSSAIATIENYSSIEECHQAKLEYIAVTQARAWCIPGPTKK